MSISGRQPTHDPRALRRAAGLEARERFTSLHYSAALELQRGRFSAAERLINKALALDPEAAEALADRGNALRGMGRYDEALRDYDRALALRPDLFTAHYNRGVVLSELDRDEEAVRSYDRALELKSDLVVALYNRGNLLRKLGRPGEALRNYNRILVLDPNHAQAHFRRGIALLDMGRRDAALASYEAAIAIKPDFVQALFRCGNLLRELERIDEALSMYDRALAVEPHNMEISWNAAVSRLQKGDFGKGWREYEARWMKEKDGTFRGRKHVRFAEPQWTGSEDIAGKAILLHAEQGLGDAIQFCRYTELVAQRGARVILEIHPALRTLADYQLNSGVDQIFSRGEELPPFDYQCPLMSLPLAFRTRLETIPVRTPYFSVDAEKARLWSKRLGTRTRPRVGLVWSGNPNYINDLKRSVPLSLLAGITNAGADFISLQKELRAGEVQLLETLQIGNFSDALVDFTDTAALASLMDVVVSVDTSVAHLGGALGLPTWILLPCGPDWRWLLDREDSPWYPTVRLFRQREPGDWAETLQRVRISLDSLHPIAEQNRHPLNRQSA